MLARFAVITGVLVWPFRMQTRVTDWAVPARRASAPLARPRVELEEVVERWS